MVFLIDVQTIVGLLSVFNNIIDSPLLQTGILSWSSSPTTFEYKFPQNQVSAAHAISTLQFPDDFYFGVATSAYQIEGAWNTDGKGPSVWDVMTHEKPTKISDQSNADVACDSYHKYKEDIQLVQSLGCNMYRISLSWPRILPTGYSNDINKDGLRYYNDVINEMIMNGITPMVTLFHWDLPYTLQQLGGWTNPLMQDLFVEYARVAFSAFGDRVKYWITINEPLMVCRSGYGENDIPGMNQSGIADYMCGHNILLGHAKVYQMYNREFRPRQNGKVGIVLDLHWFEPANPYSKSDAEAIDHAFQFYNDWFVHPIFSEKGDYPEMMKGRVRINSYLQGFAQSRLPIFSRDEIKKIKGSADIFGINFYTATLVRGVVTERLSRTVNFDTDVGLSETFIGDWPGDTWVRNTPWAFGKLLRRINTLYDLPEIFITENGYSDHGEIRDVGRTSYYHAHLWEVLEALRGGVDIRGYLAWSLLDSFEWTDGYRSKFGLYSVDFNSDNRTRTPKLSSNLIKDIYKSRKIRNIVDIIGSEYSSEIEKYKVEHAPSMLS